LASYYLRNKIIKEKKKKGLMPQKEI